MFVGFMNFTWNKVTKKLTLIRKQPFNGAHQDNIAESLLLWVYNYKPDLMLLNDPQVFPWIQDYAYALVLISVGNAREKFASIAGPQGGTSLNGAVLKQEGAELLKELDLQIQNFVDGGQPMTWITG